MVSVPRLSILIPCVGKAEQVETTLVSVLENRPDDCEVLVVHDGSYRDQYALDDEVRFVLASEGAGLVSLVNAGLAETRGDFVHVLQSGLRVREGWSDEALRHFLTSDVGSVAPLVIDAETSPRVKAAGVAYGTFGSRRVCLAGAKADGRLRPKPLGPTLGAGFYRREWLAALGGLDTEIGEALADIDLALSLQALGQRCAFAATCRIEEPTPGTRLSEATSRERERLFWRHAGTIGWMKSLVAHSLAVLADVVRPNDLLGRLAAFFEFGGYARFRRRIQQAHRSVQSAGDRSAPDDTAFAPLTRAA